MEILVAYHKFPLEGSPPQKKKYIYMSHKYETQ